MKGNRRSRTCKLKLLKHQKNSNTDNLAVAEEANFDEAVTAEVKDSNDTEIDLKEEQNKQ